MNNAHGYDTKRFPLTAAQGRVLYHLERIFRSTGHGMREYQAFLEGAAVAGLDASDVATWGTTHCVAALRMMEDCAKPMAGFRAVDTGWRDFAPECERRVNSYAAWFARESATESARIVDGMGVT